MEETLSQEEIFRYSRHLMLPEVGLSGQHKMKKSSVLVVGAGGLGSPIALYLAAAGVGRIGLVDYDVVELSNLQRQIIHGTASLGTKKVLGAQRRLSDMNPQIQVDTFDTVLTSENIKEIAGGYDVLVDGSDNLPTRYLMNDFAWFSGKPYVYGSIYRFEGQVSVFDARVGPCYRCLFPEAPSLEYLPGCSDSGVLGVLPGIIGSIEASETIKVLLGIGEPLIGRLLLLDALAMQFSEIELRKNLSCPLCGDNPTLLTLQDYEQFCGVPYRTEEGNIPSAAGILPQELVELMKNKSDIFLIDVRDPVESQVSELPGAVSIPLERLISRLGEIPSDKLVVAFCRSGQRSAQAVRVLKKAGFTQAAHLAGGINAWVRQIDPSMKQY